ncbi:sugar phosphate nucleotidyltransferase [Schleiferiaceae bacterium]|nr:sugar phosphate nucleotidyltransferase [Schleiferiaceae bacterium]
MRDYKAHLVKNNIDLSHALRKLDELGADAVLFIVDNQDQLIGSLTDGDVRRGLLKGLNLNDPIIQFAQKSPKFIRKSKYSLTELIELRKNNFRIIPVLNNNNVVLTIINFRFLKSYLPIDAMIMAGGLGSRLKPLTDSIPKPLLKVGERPILDYGLNNLERHGISSIYISVRYLGDQIVDYIKSRKSLAKTNIIWEEEPLGTLGSATLVDSFDNDIILITNSDILTNIDYEKFVLDFINSGADMSVVSIPYKVKIPYAVMETVDNKVIKFQEKPSYTYYSNGGIYLVKKKLIDSLPYKSFYNTTDLMEQVINSGGTLRSYPLKEYWIDIGRPEDYKKANVDIQNINFI